MYQPSGDAPVNSMWTPAELPSSNVPGQVVMKPLDDDIILGRGVPISKYEGNIRFRELIRGYKGEYMATGRHHRKQQIVEEVLEKLRERNCRFLSRIETDEEARKCGLPPGSRVWVIAREEVALSKVKQALREMESSASPKTPKSPARSDASAPRSRKKKPPVRGEAANADGALPLHAGQPLPQPVAPVAAAAVSSSLPTTSAASIPNSLPTPAMLVPQQLPMGWNLPQVSSTAGLSQATMSNTLLQLAGQQSLATLLQPPPLQQPIMPFIGSVQQAPQLLWPQLLSLASLNGAAPNFPFPNLTANSSTMPTTQWLEQQRNITQQQVTQHFDGLWHQYLLQQQQRDLLRQHILLQQAQNQQSQAQALYLSRLEAGTSDVTRQALLSSMSQLNQPPPNLGTMLQLGTGNASAQAGIGGLPSSMVNPMPQGNAFVSTTMPSAPIDAMARRNSEPVIMAPSETNQEAATATPGISRERESRSEGHYNTSANAKSSATQGQSTFPRENPTTVTSAHDAASPSDSQSRRGRRETDRRKSRHRSTDSSSDESGSSSDSSESKSSSSSSTPKTGRIAPKKLRES
jgi:hypothetical protein